MAAFVLTASDRGLLMILSSVKRLRAEMGAVCRIKTVSSSCNSARKVQHTVANAMACQRERKETYRYAHRASISWCSVLSAAPDGSSVRELSSERGTGTHLACALVDDISGHSDGSSFVHDANFCDQSSESHSSAHCDKR